MGSDLKQSMKLVGVYRKVVLDYSAEYEYEVLLAEHFDVASTVLIFTTSFCPSTR